MSKALRNLPHKPRLRGLYAITDSALIESGQLVQCVEQALRGRATLIQYRDKDTDIVRREQEARALLKLCRAYQVPLIVNDDIRLAKIIGADGVHLGRDDVTPAEAREILGAEAIIGVSCYNSLELAFEAAATGADYVAFGSFFSSHTKPEAVKADLALLRQARAQLSVPIAAIGGITIGQGAGLIEAGADLLAVVHGLFAEADIFTAAQQYARLFK